MDSCDYFNRKNNNINNFIEKKHVQVSKIEKESDTKNKRPIKSNVDDFFLKH